MSYRIDSREITPGRREALWSRLNTEATALVVKSSPREEFAEALEPLRQIERWFANPGGLAVQAIAGALEGGEHGEAARLVRRGWEELVRPPRTGGPPSFTLLVVDAMMALDPESTRHAARELRTPEDPFVYDVVVVPSAEDALIAVLANPSIRAVLVGPVFDLRGPVCVRRVEAEAEALVAAAGRGESVPLVLGQTLAALRPDLDLYLITGDRPETIPTAATRCFRRIAQSWDGGVEMHLAILEGVQRRFETPFFDALKAYSQRPVAPFHALPLARGGAVFDSPWLDDFATFYGRRLFLAETSGTGGGLDSLLAPRGPLRDAQRAASRAFGSHQSWFVTNGTSTANKIVLQGILRPSDIVMIDRNCHKSHHYAMVLTDARPLYLDAYPIPQVSSFGGVPIQTMKKAMLNLHKQGQLDRLRAVVLTNVTFDGIVYHPERVMTELLAIKPDLMFLWDEAWFAFARADPMWRTRTAMGAAESLAVRLGSAEHRDAFRRQGPLSADRWLDSGLLPDPDTVRVRVYATQSTHKTLSSLRQGAMIHARDEDFHRDVGEAFHAAYMTHTSTSPNYQILASLDVARRQLELEGYRRVQEAISLGLELRARIRSSPLLSRWLNALGPSEMVPDAYRRSRVTSGYEHDRDWHQVAEAWRSDEFTIDPTKVTLHVGRSGIDGEMFRTRYLMDEYGIQVNKTSTNSILLMTNIGTRRGSVTLLLDALTKICEDLEAKVLRMNPAQRTRHDAHTRELCEVHEMAPAAPFHPAFSDAGGAGALRDAYYRGCDESAVRWVDLDDDADRAFETGESLVAASFVTPYPPGFPALVPGQLLTREVLHLLRQVRHGEVHGLSEGGRLRVLTRPAAALP